MPRARYSYSSSLSGYFPPGVKWLLIVNTAIFLVCYLGGFPLQRHVNALFSLSAEGAVRTFMIWQVFTYMFVHFGTFHLLFNMLALWMFGLPIEQTWGTRRFLKFYFQCGVVAGVCVLVVNMLVGDWLTPTLGASGAVFGLLVAFGILFPDAIMLMFFLFPMRAKYAVMIYVAVEILATLGGGNTGISTIAHLGGAAFSYLYLKGRIPVWKRRLPDVRGAYRQWKLQRAKRKFQVYMRKHDRGGPWVN
jgi:membrane associated rhomboid family serine protease